MLSNFFDLKTFHFKWFLLTYSHAPKARAKILIFLTKKKHFSPFRVGPPFPPWCHVWARISPCAHLAGFRLRFLFLSNFSILKKSRRIPVLSPHCTCVNYQFFNLVSCKQRRIEKWNFLSAHVSTSFSRNSPSGIVVNSPNWKALDVAFASWSIKNLEWHRFCA